MGKSVDYGNEVDEDDEEEEGQDFKSQVSDEEALQKNYLDQTEMISSIKQVAWKPAKNISYETLALTDSQLNCKIRGAGFRPNGKFRTIKNTCLLSKIRTRCRLRKRNPAMAICVTMYNEEVEELKLTLSGLIHNYNLFRLEKDS